MLTPTNIEHLDKFYKENLSDINSSTIFEAELLAEVERLKEAGATVSFKKETRGNPGLYIIFAVCTVEYNGKTVEGAFGGNKPHNKYAALIRALHQLLG